MPLKHLASSLRCSFVFRTLAGPGAPGVGREGHEGEPGEEGDKRE